MIHIYNKGRIFILFIPNTAEIMKYILAVFFTLFSIPDVLHSQNLLDGKKSADIPFEYVNNFIIINVVINEKIPLKFIFDTGAEHTILTKRQFTEIAGLKLEKEFKILGADLTTEMSAFLSRAVSFKISKVLNPVVDILVFKEDYFKFEELTGVDVHGIIGANIFSKFVLSINYKKRKITLHDPFYFKPPTDKYTTLPISVFKNKPYLTTMTRLSKDDPPVMLKYLVDTGASLGLLLYNETHESIVVPENVIHGVIGIGLGGHLEGFLGRIHLLEMDDLQLNDVLTNFQEVQEFPDTSFMNDRNGIIGNLVLDRFDVIIDYQRQNLLLKPTKRYHNVFKYDRSGISMIASGRDLNVFVISNVIPDSPAGEAGVQKGDIIIKVNWMPTGYFSMNDLVRLFQKREGKKIKLTVLRNGEKIMFEFRLRDLI